MDCDDVILLLVRDGRTLTPGEEVQLDEHLTDCDACCDLVSHHELLAAAPRMLELPVVEPDRFEGETVIAAGGMGKITRAFDRRLGREVAIKEMLGPELRGRFEREAAITARLQHPAIVPVYEAGEWPNGSAFYTMRLVPGGTLADAIERATTFADRLALLPHVVAVTDALAYAHARGIIHRDLKPQNILVGEFGETVVIDWGLAKEVDEVEPRRDAAEAAPQLTSAGTVIGTPCFMPPEQARGHELDARADVFALGALLYNVLTGVPPYWDQSRDTKELIDAVLARPPTPLGELAPTTPADLRAIVERAMAREPLARYRDAGELAAELRRFQAGQLLLSREYRVRDLL
ncbi:MAG TPA: serine/threonine-protein kinase, partial [Kofleriaceae bacterium]|nr:serine/threonine-protein kinase [Kofleriaceae bacterium]